MTQCPICKSKENYQVEKFKSAVLSGSLLYKDIIIMHCNNCGHKFNSLSNTDIENLQEYYKEEYIIDKYNPTQHKNDYFGMFYDLEKSLILDSNNLINYEWIDKKYNFIVLDHVLEHYPDLTSFMKEIQKSITSNGYIYVAVPDVSRYEEVGYPYCYLIKEHVHHFSEGQVLWLFKEYGFKPVNKIRNYDLKILNGAAIIPSIEFLFQRVEETAPVFNPDGTYCFGIGREFLYMYERDFKGQKIDGLIDDTPSKLNKNVDGIIIYNSDIIPKLSEESLIYITSWYHKEKMTNKLKELGYKGLLLEGYKP